MQTYNTCLEVSLQETLNPKLPAKEKTLECEQNKRRVKHPYCDVLWATNHFKMYSITEIDSILSHS